MIKFALCVTVGLLIGLGGEGQASAEVTRHPLSPEADAIAKQALQSGDTQGRPFIIVDKLAARVFAFDGAGVLIGDTPALLGLSPGDESVPGIGTMRLAEITTSMRTTPAGRYDAHLGVNLAGHKILWVDYDAALSLHPVVTSNAKEHRLQRLATPSILDNRISYGCINVPARFYDDIVQPLFAPADGIVYILPETAASNLVLIAPQQAVLSN